MEYLRAHQLNIMLFMSGMCGMLAFLSFISKALSPKRRRILTLLEISAMLLLISDWQAYHFRGVPGWQGYVMVRVSNFLVFFLALFMIHEITLFLYDLSGNEVGMSKYPRRLLVCEALFAVGVVLIVLSQFTGLYYSFDETNTYHRGSCVFLSFIIPSVIALLQLSVVLQYRKKLNQLIVISLVISTVVPLIASAVQFLAYGVSLTNMSLVGVVIVLHVFVQIDLNRTVRHSRDLETEIFRKEKEKEHSLFEQTAESLVSAIDAKDKYTHGHSSRVAAYSQQIARDAGKSEEECEEIYFAALLHDVGKIGIPDSIINKEGKLTEEEYAAIKLHPVYGYQILSKIGASPYLSIGARYHHERYDGTGYPDGLVGESIPEIARIIAVADAYDAMTSKRSYRDPIPQQKVREELVKGMGTQFDPALAKIMIHLVDMDTTYRMQELENGSDPSFNESLACVSMGRDCTVGILMNDHISRIHLSCRPIDAARECRPAAILFDSLDALVQDTDAKKKDLFYCEYAVLRFDGQTTADGVRKAETRVIPRKDSPAPKAAAWGNPAAGTMEYDLEAVRVNDHVMIRVTDEKQTRETVLALPDNTRFAYLSLTGENCLFQDFRITEDQSAVPGDYIPRIAEEISYIAGYPEGDLPNIQISGWREASTPGVPVDQAIRFGFYTKSLPAARLVWHCPFVCLFTGEDRKVEGKGYREFALVRLDGENWHTDDQVSNETSVSMTEAFPGWEEWKNRQKHGVTCEIALRRDNDSVILDTENLGIRIHSVITVRGFTGPIYAALTGDQCIITDIRVSRG